jgi:hypothetical protein
VDNRPKDPLDLRVTKAKKRSIWSVARLTTLLTSPIYTGCSTVHRRWKPVTGSSAMQCTGCPGRSCAIGIKVVTTPDFSRGLR